jgi:hypothetical protein
MAVDQTVGLAAGSEVRDGNLPDRPQARARTASNARQRPRVFMAVNSL